MTQSPVQALRLLVSGRVQGVGFRHFTRVQARELELVGTVANLMDGRVEIEVAGPPEALADFERRVRSGPRLGRVEAVERAEIPAGDWTDFRVIHK